MRSTAVYDDNINMRRVREEVNSWRRKGRAWLSAGLVERERERDALRTPCGSVVAGDDDLEFLDVESHSQEFVEFFAEHEEDLKHSGDFDNP